MIALRGNRVADETAKARHPALDPGFVDVAEGQPDLAAPVGRETEELHRADHHAIVRGATPQLLRTEGEGQRHRQKQPALRAVPRHHVLKSLDLPTRPADYPVA